MRWSYLLPRLTLLVLVWAFFFFAFDPILKWSLVKAAQKAAGAKVEISTVKTSFLHPSLKITGVTVGNAGQEYENLLEFSELKFGMLGAPLLEKKVVVEEASLSGLKFGTTRKTSAKLPFTKKEETPQFIQELRQESKSFALDRYSDIKTGAVDELQVSADSLSSVKAYDELSKKYEEQYAALSKKAEFKEYKERIDKLKAGYEDAKSEKNTIKQIEHYGKLSGDINKLSSEFKKDQKLLENTVSGLVTDVKSADEARKQDLQTILGKLKMPSLDAKSLGAALAGPAIESKTQTALKWMALSKKYMPENSQKQIVKTTTPRGRVIHFPKQNAYPSFLIKRLAVNGEMGLEAPLAYAGDILNITTNPALWGKPLTIDLKGSGSGRIFKFNAALNTAATPLSGKSALFYSGISVSSLKLGNDSLGADISGGKGAFDGSMNFTGENLSADAVFKLTEANITPKADKITFAPLKNAFTNAFSGLNALQMGVKIAGTFTAPALTINTDLADKLSAAFKNALGPEVEKAKAQAQAKIDAAIKPYKDKYTNMTAAKQKELKDKLNASKSGLGDQIDGLLKNLTKQSGPGKIKLPKIKF